ncbi:MAG: hypothetical protein QME21_17085 [Anaerolineales bacterium]|nr:hypothetical protein [Anaerolineales bacterium]
MATHEINKSEDHTPGATPEIERRLRRLYSHMQPQMEFTRRLEERLLENKDAQTARQPAPRLSRALRWLGSLAALALIAAMAAFAIQRLRPGQPGQPIPADLPASATVVPTSTVTAAETEPPRSLGIAAAACNIPLAALSNSEVMPSEQQPQALAGGGTVTSGDFTYKLWLTCGSQFSRAAQGYRFSEIDGLGLLTRWRYHGPDLESQYPDSRVVEYAGFEPFVVENGEAGPVQNNVGAASLLGIQFPSDVLPDFSQMEVKLRYVVKTVAPGGRIGGAALSFTLQRRADGYYPVNVQITPLTEQELSQMEDQPTVTPSFPLLDAQQLYPELKTLRELLNRWQMPLIDEAGWLHRKTQVEDHGRNDLYPGVHEYTTDEWLLLDDNRQVIAFIYQDHTSDGRVLQQTVAEDGQARNLTFGETHNFVPYRLDFGSGLYDSALQALRHDIPVQPKVATLDGRQVWIYRFVDQFPQPMDLEGIHAAGIAQQETLDAHSGALLTSETYALVVEGEPRLLRRLTYLSIERVEQPPAEMLALFDAPMDTYSPPPPQGKAPPADFDLAQSKLTLRSIPGDNFTRPTFWYGDLYAGDYLLGRVDFGFVLGGWCDRSANGLRLAFNHITQLEDGGSFARLHWLDLRSPGVVQSPLPDLDLRSPVAWAPLGERLAFWACQAQENCGLYLYDVASSELRFLFNAPPLSQSPLWSPDGLQIAFPAPDNPQQVTILRSTDGQVIYTGAPQDLSSQFAWVNLTQGMSSFGRCENP